MVRGVVFDFDGTLAESRDAVAATVNEVLAAAGHPRVLPAWVHGMMGLPLEVMLAKAVPRTQRPDDVTALADAYRELFPTVGMPRVRPMPEADEVLSALEDAGLGVAIATSRGALSLVPILARFGWTGRFRSLATCERVVHGKPAPDLMHLALEESGWAAGEALLVGDTRWDMEMAVAAGVRAIGVSHGSHDERELRAGGAEVVLPDLRGVLGLAAG